MDPQWFTDRETGRVVKTMQGYHAFVPAPPPQALPLDAATELALSRADAAMGNYQAWGGTCPTRNC